MIGAVLVVSACGAQELAPAPNITTETAPSDAGKAFSDRFTADSASAPWKGSVISARLDGRGVLVVTSLAKTDKATAVKVCDAVFAAAKPTVPDLVSVTVRTATDNSIVGTNTMRGDKSCRG